MSAWIVYSKNGNAKCEARKLEYSGEFLGACSVNVSITSPVPIGFEIGDWLEYRGERFELNYDPSVVKNASVETSGDCFTYENIVFNSLSDELTRCDFLDYVPSDNQIHYSSLPNFTFFADTIAKLAERIQVNLDRVYQGEKKWTVRVHPEYVNKQNVTISINSVTCWDALALVKSQFDANFIVRNRVITIGTAGLPVERVFSYGKGNGLITIEKNAESNQKIVTRLRAYGSTKNMPSRYYANLKEGLPNNLAINNLMLPSFPDETLDPYLDSANITELGVREGTVFFDGSSDLDEIYPSMEGMTAEDLKAAGIDVASTGRLDEILGCEAIEDNGVFEDDTDVPPFTLLIKDVGFDLNEHLSTESATISLKDGMCGGRDFEIVSCEKEGDHYALTCNRHYDSGLDLYFPYKSFPIQTGDKFVLLGIEMPDVYIKAASQRLFQAAKNYLSKNDYVRYSYTPQVDAVFMARQHDEAIRNGLNSLHDTIKEGGVMLFEDADLGVEGSVLIDSLQITEYADDSRIPAYEITLRNDKTVGMIDKIQNQIDSIVSGQTGVSGGGYNSSQIKSLILSYGEKFFLSKVKDDRTSHSLGVGKSLEVGGNASVGGNLSVGMKGIFGEKITAKKGLQIGETFIPGILTGSGGFFDEYANGEVESLIIRRFLEVPELRFNRVEIKLGDKWNAPGAGIFESVEPDYDEEGDILSTGTGYLKLEEGEYGAIAVGDICMGIFHSMNASENATEDSDDSRGNFQFAGFYTCYFTITEITGKDNKQFRYQMRPVSDRWKLTYHPSEAMTFVCYGSFTREDRQTSVYTTRTYTRLLKNQNTWEISASNIAMQYGNMENMSIHGLDMTGYSMYLNNIYMTGVLKQVKPDGSPVNVANDRGNWIGGTEYAYYDRVSHNGSLWLCVNENGTDTEPIKGNSDWLLQVASGASLSAEGRFNSSAAPYQPNSVVEFADKVWINTEVTSNAPFGCWTDNSGNRLLFNDGGFILADETKDSAWQILIDISGFTDGKDGEGLVVQYSADKVNWHDTFLQNSDIYMRQKVGKDGVWSEAMRIVGEDGQAKDGVYTDFQFAVNSSLTTAPTTGWQDGPPTVGLGQFLWMRVRVVNPNEGTTTSWEVTRVGGEKGDAGKNGVDGQDGQSISLQGDWKTGITVPYLGVVRMGGASWSAKKDTTNPPMWCWTDNNGNRLLFNNGGYALTGAINTEEYQEVASDGTNGKDGANGKDGTNGKDGKDGKDGLQGIQGCVIRDSEWASGVEYRNDEGTANGYIDVVLVRDNSTTTGWVAYKCKKTHTSSSSITPTNTTYWEEFAANVSAIFTSLIIAKNAKITFLQGNQLIIQKSNGTITAGISGSDAGSKTRIWAGSQAPDSAPFRVNEAGEAWMDDAHIKGEVEATSGTIANFSIEGGTLVNNDSRADIILRNSKTNATREAMIGLQSIPSTTGGAAMGVFRNHEEYGANFGIIVSAKNGNINDAINIEAGCISGVAYKTKVVYSGSATISRGVNVIVLVNSVSAITLPKLEACDDGYRMIVVNKRNVPVNIYGNGSNFFITTDNFISTSVPAGASAEFVFVNELSHTFPSTEVGTKTGAWVKL